MTYPKDPCSAQSHFNEHLSSYHHPPHPPEPKETFKLVSIFFVDAMRRYEEDGCDEQMINELDLRERGQWNKDQPTGIMTFSRREEWGNGSVKNLKRNLKRKSQKRWTHQRNLLETYLTPDKWLSSQIANSYYLQKILVQNNLLAHFFDLVPPTLKPRIFLPTSSTEEMSLIGSTPQDILALVPYKSYPHISIYIIF